MKYELEVTYNNADTGETDSQSISVQSADSTLEFLAISCSGRPTGEMFEKFFKKMFDNPDNDLESAGVLYSEMWAIMSNWAFSELGWGDVTVDIHGLKVDGEEIPINQLMIDINDWSLQLSRSEGYMYCYS